MKVSFANRILLLIFSSTDLLHFSSVCPLIDDGFLLYRVMWQSSDSFSTTLQKYVRRGYVGRGEQ